MNRAHNTVVPFAVVLLLASLAAIYAAESAARELSADIVMYGATSAGVPAAVAAAREGRTAILIEPSRWLGGLPGAGFRIMEDVPFPETLGGLALALFKADAARGGDPLEWQARANRRWFAEQLAPFGRPHSILGQTTLPSSCSCRFS